MCFVDNLRAISALGNLKTSSDSTAKLGYVTSFGFYLQSFFLSSLNSLRNYF